MMIFSFLTSISYREINKKMMLRRLAGQQTQRLVRKSAVRFCSTAVEETTDKGMYDPEVISSHEKQVKKHLDIFNPLLFIAGGLLGLHFTKELYYYLMEKDEQGAARVDSLVYHKKDKILGDKQAHHNTSPTLLLDVYDVLVCMTYREGSIANQTVLRPGARVFLERLKEQYEIVIYSFSDLNHMQELFGRIDEKRDIFSNVITRELIKRIDCGYWPYGVVPSFLAPRYKKNLDDIGRRPERIIHIETEEENLYDDPSQDDNRILIPRYDGGDSDEELINLIPFFEYLADNARAPFDVRKAIRFYKKKAEEYDVENIGVAFTLYQEEKKQKEVPKSSGWNIF